MKRCLTCITPTKGFPMPRASYRYWITIIQASIAYVCKKSDSKDYNTDKMCLASTGAALC